MIFFSHIPVYVDMVASKKKSTQTLEFTVASRLGKIFGDQSLRLNEQQAGEQV